MSLLARLVALVVLATIPAVAIQVWNEHALRRGRALEVHAEARHTAREAMVTLSRTVGDIRQLLSTLAEEPAVRNGNPAACNAYLARQATHYPGYVALSRAAPNGAVICRAGGGTTTSDSLADRPEVREAAQTGKFSIGNYAVDNGTPAWNVAVPLHDERGAVVGILSAGLSLHALAAEIAEHVRPDVQVVVTDRSGAVLVHMPQDPGHWIESRLPPDVFGELQRGGQSWEGASPLEGSTPRLFAAAEPTELLRGAAFVGVSLDRDAAFAAIDTASLRSASLILAGLLLAILAAVLGGEAFVRRPIAALLIAADRWRRGDYSARVELGDPHSDFGRLGHAFDAVAAALAHREAELRQNNAKLEARVSERTRALHVEAETRARTEAELRQAQKMEIVGRLTGGIAHDFNNLLTAVIGNLELLLRGSGINERGQRLADAALRAAHRGANLTSSLLAFARRQVLNLEPIDVNALLTEFSTLLRRAVGEPIVVELQLASQLCPCRADVAQLEAAVLNLAINARDAMPSGGRLVVSTNEVELTRSDLVGNPDASPGRYVAITVTDTGTGMSQEVIARAFEPFFTTKPTGSGSGLGLSQVYGFVRQVGGHVTLASEPDGGTHVTLFLPQAKATPAAAPQARTQPPVRQSEVVHSQVVTVSSATVLVVEDDGDVSELVQQTLREAGCRVIAATDGREAIHVLQSGQAVDLVFTDLVMPNGVSGLEVARRARRLCPGIAIVLTSGHDPETPEQVPLALEFPILRKPYRQAELRALIGQTLRQAPQPRRA